MSIMDIEAGSYCLRQLDKINVLMGKNGCGKSRLLRNIETHISRGNEDYGKIKYITPERGGTLKYDSGVETNMSSNPNWIYDTRRKNQSVNFKSQTLSQYRKFKSIVADKLEEIIDERKGDLREDYQERVFSKYLDDINNLLDNVTIRSAGSDFEVFLKKTETRINIEDISSGESELITLAIEILIFEMESSQKKKNILFLDEPDVHIHPDLQYKFIKFITSLASKTNIHIIIATHSTSILAALSNYANARVSFMPFGSNEQTFTAIDEKCQKIIPIFGAHPLSNVFNEKPILLVEGDDDERIWQQAVRTSERKINIYPCVCDTISKVTEYETEVIKIISVIYDRPKAYSLRDSDGSTEALEDNLPLMRLKLGCRNAENLLLTDEVLKLLTISWVDLQSRIDKWLKVNSDHIKYSVLKAFADSSYDRKMHNIKDARNVIMGLTESSKPWEVAVGQTIAKLSWDEGTDFAKETSIFNFLGEKTVKALIPKV